MNGWEQWVHRPQRFWLRRALFQVHLWGGLALGLYVLVVCLSGSAAVFNSELYAYFLPRPKPVVIAGKRMDRTEVRVAAQRAYPNAKVTRVLDYHDPQLADVVTLGIGVNAPQRFFDPYTGKDVGNARPLGLQMVSWFSQMHMNLMMGYPGRLANGVGGFLTALLTLTGLVLWWPGIRRWRDCLMIRTKATPKRLNWQLHTVIGFWTFAICFMWCLTGGYLVFPRRIDDAIHRYIAVPMGWKFNFARITHSIHVGDFAGWPMKAIWVVLGLVPPFLLVTGFIMWWNRVITPWRKRASVDRLSAPDSGAGAEKAGSPITEPVFEADSGS